MLSPMSRQRLGRKHAIAMYLCLCVLTLLIAWQLARSLVMVSVDMESSSAGTMTMSWRDKGSHYSEIKSKNTAVKSGRHTYLLVLWTLADIDKLRIKPIATQATLTFHTIVVRSLGYDPLAYDSDKQFQAFKPLADLDDFQVTHNQLSMRSVGNAAQFEFDVLHAQTNTKNAALIERFNVKLALMVLTLLIILAFAYERIHLALVIISLAIAAVYFNPFSADYAVITIEMQSVANNQLTVYWAAEHEPYEEQRARRIDTQAGNHSYRLGMGSLKAVQQVRVDPLAAKGKVLIKQIEISAMGYDPIVINAKNQFYALDFLKNNNLQMVGDALEFTADTDDAFFEISLDAEAFKIKYTYCLLALLLFMALLFYIVKLKYPDCYKTLKIINSRVGLIILSIMVMQYFFGAEHNSYVDFFNIKALLFFIALGLVVGFYYTNTQVYAVYFVFFMAVFYNTQLKQQHSTITLELQTATSSELVVYWANRFEAYQENKSTRIRTQAGKKRYRLDMGRLNDIYSIRIDPLATKGQVLFKTITITAIGYDSIGLNARNNFYAVDFKNNPALKTMGDTLVFDAENADAFFELSPNTDAFKATYLLASYLAFVVVLALINLGGTYLKTRHPERSDNLTKVSLKLGGVIIAVMLMQLLFSADYGFYVDYQANELVITTAGEHARQLDTENADVTNVNDLVHIGLLNLAYGAVVLSAVLIAGIFYSLGHVFYVAIFLLVCSAVAYVIQSQTTYITIEMTSSIENRLKVYWADGAEIYLEQHSVSVDTQKGTHRYRLPIASLNNVHTLRIEPLNAPGRAELSKIVINEVGYTPISLDANNHFYAVDRVIKSKATNKEIADRLGMAQNNLVFTATGEDTFFELIIDPDAFKTHYPLSLYMQFIAGLIGVFFYVYAIHRQAGYFQRDSAILTLRLCLVLVAVMIIQMAWLSDYDAHPDEKAHIDSIDYYTQYWDPPVVGDVRSLNTYQYPWGISRLDDLGISYMLMGKLKNVITSFAEESVFMCRLFNSLLISALVLFASRSKALTLFLIPLLCLPQVWYLFSYANRDGFALFLAILLAWQLANQHSALHRYLYSPPGFVQRRQVLLPMGLLGLLSIELSNYVIFALFFVAVLCWEGFFLAKQRQQFATRCLCLVLLAGAVFGARLAVDVAINGGNKQEQKRAFTELIAAPEFKPSVAVTDEGYFSLRLQQKGVPALTLFTPQWEWQVLTFKSFTGLYGNQGEYSPAWYYAYVAYLYGLIALVLLFAVIRYGDSKAKVLTALTVIFVAGDGVMGFLYSWLYDFQAQGRYIFPLIPMLMVYLFKMAPLWGKKTQALLLSCALLLFVLGLFSFRFVALTYLIS